MNKSIYFTYSISIIKHRQYKIRYKVDEILWKVIIENLPNETYTQTLIINLFQSEIELGQIYSEHYLTILRSSTGIEFMIYLKNRPQVKYIIFEKAPKIMNEMERSVVEKMLLQLDELN